ncbi:MAG: hypothetical protein ACRCU9_10065 [Iodobacter sp.]
MISANNIISFAHNNTFSTPSVHSLSDRVIQAAQNMPEVNTKEGLRPLPETLPKPLPLWTETDEAFYQGLLLLDPNDPSAICTYLDKFNQSHGSPYNTLAQQMKILNQVMSKIKGDLELKKLYDNMQTVQISKWNLQMTMSEWMREIICSEGKSPEDVDW